MFFYNKWESVKELIYLLGRIDMHHLIDLRKILFLQRLKSCNNCVMSELYNFMLHSAEYISLFNQVITNSRVIGKLA